MTYMSLISILIKILDVSHLICLHWVVKRPQSTLLMTDMCNRLCTMLCSRVSNYTDEMHCCCQIVNSQLQSVSLAPCAVH